MKFKVWRSADGEIVLVADGKECALGQYECLGTIDLPVTPVKKVVRQESEDWESRLIGGEWWYKFPSLPKTDFAKNIKVSWDEEV
jgi:hypothetical protein